MADLEIQGKKAYYETHGSGEPILLLNGIMMSTKSWAPFIENFSASNRLILVDFFDQGQSERMKEPYDHSVQMDLIEGLLDVLKLDMINICGISYGAEVGLGFALRHPQRVRRMVLFNGTARTPPLLADMGHAWNEAAKLDGGLAYYLATIPMIYSDTFYEREAAWMSMRKETLLPVFADAEFRERIVRLTNSSETFNVVESLGLLQMPVLIVSAEKDNLIPLREQKNMVKKIKNVHHVIIPDCGHASMYERPMIFSSLTLGFINSKNSDFKI